jgi:hypothetical protein
MLCKLHKPFVNIALLSMIVLGLSVMHRVVISASPSISQSQCELVVLSNPDDPYYPLAEEIAAFENAPILHSLPDAMDCHPIFLLWVVSPAFLSDAIMIEFGQTMKEQPSAVSSGIITASTLERARDLWERRAQVRGQRFFAANAPNPSALINQGQIIAFNQGGTTTHPLTKTGFRNILLEADYLTFTGHGGSTFLRLDENTTITPVDIPSLNSVVISTGSCQTFRLWNEDSIARSFVDQGAAAYSGFVFSPNEGYLIGEFNGLPLRYTWGDFPIGHAIQAQNRGTLQGFAQFPYQFLLGDPRIALQTNPPYRLVDDHQEDGRRILTFRNVPQGVIPIRISDGAAYQFVEVPGVTAASEGEPFYNSRLQMVNIRNEKFILLVHGGGELTLRLRSQAPWYWFPGDILLDSLDHTLIFSQQSGGGFVAIVFSIIPLVWIGWQLFKKRLIPQNLRLAVLIGIGATILQGSYVLLRLDQVTITSKAVVFTPLSIVAAFVLSTCGALIYYQTSSRIGKVAALLVFTFASWMPMVFGLVLLAAFNLFAFIPETGTALYNYSLGLLPAGSFLFSTSLYSLVLWWVNTRISKQARM